MRHILRSWIAMAAFGAGLIHLAVAAASPPLTLAGFALVGIAELVWAVLTLARGRYILPKIAPVLALLPLAVWALSIATGVESAATPVVALAAATLLDLIASIAVVIERRQGRESAVAPEPAAGRLMLGLLAGAFAMAAITLPALGQTVAGIAASEGPHAHHGVELDVPLDHEEH
jgi:hypothetical protein